VAELFWKALSPLQHAAVPGLAGAAAAEPGIALSELRDFNRVQVMARRGRWKQAAAATKKLFGATPPDSPRAVFAKNAVLIWSGPDQFLALTERTAGHGFENPLAGLKDASGDAASLSDQSDGRCLIRISGPRVRDALAKLVSLDLHDSAFPAGIAAATALDHTSINLWRAPDADGLPVYDMLVFTSFADSLWHAMLDAAAEYGVRVGASISPLAVEK
jgi:sarcosine oxidase subunit gamma